MVTLSNILDQMRHVRLINIYIDGVKIPAVDSDTILEVAQKAKIYIPSICYHPDLPPFNQTKVDKRVFRGEDSPIEGCTDIPLKGCELCLVEVEGHHNLAKACTTLVAEGMKVSTKSKLLQETRQEKLKSILVKHPHACLVCAQREGCSREPCSLNVPLEERCCEKLGNCELERVAEYIGIKKDTQRYVPTKFAKLRDEPIFLFNYNLCIECTRCVRACQDLRGVKALRLTCKDGEVFVGTKNSSLTLSGCRFCGACVEVCPTGAITDKDKEGEKGVVPCISACPVNMNIPSYIRLISEEKLDKAVAVIRQKSPFPRVLGYVCHHLCESSCRRRELNESIAICHLKRYVTNQTTDLKITTSEKALSTGKKVAIVGSGPAGLTVAYYLAKKGHSVTVFEALPKLGGMLRVGILRYRLPEEELQRDIDEILEDHVEAKTNTEVGTHVAFNTLTENYDAVFIGVGAQESQQLNIKGIKFDGVSSGLDLLKEVNLGKKTSIGRRVLVIGGGNVAIDVARTTVRLGAITTVLYRRSEDELPAEPEEVDEARREGVQFRFLLAPKEILGENRQVSGVKCFQMKLGEPDESGRRRPIPIEGSETVIEADAIVMAIGEKPDLSFLPKAACISNHDILEVNTATMETSIAGVFAGGDVVSGPSSVIQAIAMGRKAAESIDKSLGGNGIIDDIVEKDVTREKLGQEASFVDKKQVSMPCLPIRERQGSFALVKLGYNRSEAMEESRRCLQCDLRFQIKTSPQPPEEWLNLDLPVVSNIPETEGVYRLLNANKETIFIKGTMNLKRELEEQLTNPKARYFLYEEAKLFTARESELLQQFLKRHGKMPEQNVDVDDLY